MNADERREQELEKNKFDMLLNFINHEGFKKLMDLREGRVPKLDGEGEINSGPAQQGFLDDVESLPERRILKAAPIDDYVAKKMAELRGKLERSGLEFKTGEDAPPDPKPFTYTRKVVAKRTING